MGSVCLRKQAEKTGCSMNEEDLSKMPVAGTTISAGDKSITKGGLTLRQHYVGLAIEGMMAAHGHPRTVHAETIAQRAIEIADAAIKLLAKDAQK